MSLHDIRPAEETRFQNLHDLARLPYFEVQEGRLVLKDRSVGPIVDMHTHVALAYALPLKIDLFKESEEVRHYLPIANPLDLEVYANRNFTPQQLKQMKRDLALMSVTDRGMRATHTAANLVKEMGDLGITHSVVLPIDLPGLSNNAFHAMDAMKRDQRIVSYGSVHPFSWDVAGKLDAQAHGGIRGVKVHPAVQLFRPDNPKAMKLYRQCGERGLPVLWHCGPVGIELRISRYCSQVRFYEKPIAENPKTTFLLGHAGALQMEEALKLSQKYPNVMLELSSQSLSHLRKIFKEADPDRLVFGTDWPFYHQGFGLAKLLMATEGRPELREKALFRNAARLLKLPG